MSAHETMLRSNTRVSERNPVENQGHTDRLTAKVASSRSTRVTHQATVQPQAIAGQDESQQKMFNDALSYMHKLKSRFVDRPEVYSSFLDTMRDFRSGGIDTLGMIIRVSELFVNYPDLIKGFTALQRGELPLASTIEQMGVLDDTAPALATPYSSNAFEASSGAGLLRIPQPIDQTPQLDRDATIDQRFCFGNSQKASLEACRPVQPESASFDQVEKHAENDDLAHVTGKGTQGSIVARRNDHNVSHQRNQSSEVLAEPTTEEQESASSSKKKRRKAREALRDANQEREEIRKRLVGTYTLDGARSLEYATKPYNVKRSELQQCMANGELNQEDALEFPILRKNDLSAPKKGKNPVQQTSSNEQKITEPKQKHNTENNPPTLMTDTMLRKLLEDAIEAREKYEEAHSYLDRAPPQGRSHLKDARKHFEARIELAAKRYRKKIDAVEAAYPNGLPAKLARELWTYDEEVEKRGRNSGLMDG